MKRYLMISSLALLIMGLCATDVFAGHKKFKTPEHYVTFSFFIHPCSIGYKHLVLRNLYLTGNLDYCSSDEELLLQTGAAYMIPRKIIIFRFFGGGGIEFSRNNGYMHPYVMVGTKLWIIHFDIVHPLRQNREPGYRFGFIFSF